MAEAFTIWIVESEVVSAISWDGSPLPASNFRFVLDCQSAAQAERKVTFQVLSI